jgi:hypothetical protein
LVDALLKFWIVTDGSTNQQPYGFLRQPVGGQENLTPGKLAYDRPLGAFGYFPPIPKIVVDVFGQLLNRDWLAVAIGRNCFRFGFAAPAILALYRQLLF